MAPKFDLGFKFLYVNVFFSANQLQLNIQYRLGGFSKFHPSRGDRFFSHRGSAYYSVQPPTGADVFAHRNSTAIPPRNRSIICLKTWWVETLSLMAIRIMLVTSEWLTGAFVWRSQTSIIITKKKKVRKKTLCVFLFIYFFRFVGFDIHQTIFTTDWKALPFGRDGQLKILIISKDSTCTQEKNTLTCINSFSQK